MSLSQELGDPRRSNFGSLRWDSAWIDPALRRMAEAAAEQAGVSVEQWMERAIRQTCNLPLAAAESTDEPSPSHSAEARRISDLRGEAEAQLPPQAPEPEQPMAERAPDAMPLRAGPGMRPPISLEEPMSLPRPFPAEAGAPSPRQEHEQRNKLTNLVWAAIIAAVAAVIFIAVLRDPSLLGRAVLGRHASEQGQIGLPPPADLDRMPPVAATVPGGSGFTVAASADNSRTTAMLPAGPLPAPAQSVAAPAIPAPQASVAPATAPALPQPKSAAALSAAAPLPPPANEVSAPILPPAIAPPMAAAPASPSLKLSDAKPPLAPVMSVPAPAAAPNAAAAPAAANIADGTNSNGGDAHAASSPSKADEIPAPPNVEVATAATMPPPSPAATTKPREIDTAEAAKLAASLEGPARAGDHTAEYRLAILYALGKGVERDYDRAAQLMRHAAEAGLADAEYDYGVLCDKGLGVAKNAAEAVRWYGKAARQGHAPAELNLGYAYAEGQGVTRNLAEAAKWFRRAAEAGLINAEFNLAYMYEQGAGVPKSAVEALAWYSLAAERGDRGAQDALDRLTPTVSAKEQADARVRAAVLKKSIRVPG